jgi:hypothetical protein
VLLCLVIVVYAGGWSLVTVKHFPDFAVAGKPLNLTFMAWVPSLDPLAICGEVRATNAEHREIKVKAKAGARAGEYRVTLILPEPGDWVLTFDTEYRDTATMPRIPLYFTAVLSKNVW